MEYDPREKNVLVTGASGFIGRRVAEELLKKGARVRAMARNISKARELESAGAEVVAGDMTDRSSLDRAVRGCQAVFHFAGATNEFKPYEYYARVNVEGSRVLGEAAVKEGVERFIHISTVWVYGLWSEPGTCETSACRKSGQAYSDTKLEAEMVIRKLIEDRGLPAIILQPSEVYGPADPNWTARPIELIKAGKMVLADSGKGVIQPIFIDDLVQGILAAAGKGKVGETYILCGPDVVTIQEYFSYFAGMMGKGRLPSVPGRIALGTAALSEWASRLFRKSPVFTRQEILATMATATYDGTKAERELGFVPKTSLSEGMREVKKWLDASDKLSK